MKNNRFLLFTVDVEDWFQVENFKSYIPFSSWPSYKLRVERNTHRLLDLFDSLIISEPDGPKSLKATFFILGWIAKRCPNLIREIANRGHEVASHGFGHELCFKMSKQELFKDLVESRKILEDIVGIPVEGYRAPSFSISSQVLSVIAESGFRYDSSYNSFALHDRYGYLNCLPQKKKGISFKMEDNFFELPISNLNYGSLILPWGGGGYFRLIPTWLYLIGVKRILTTENAFLFYIHSWEIDTSQPRLRDISTFYRFRHYINLKQTSAKLTALVRTFHDAQFITCQNYLNWVQAQK